MNTEQKSVRIDKWLWAVRVYKTRTAAADACKGGHVTIAGNRVKPSHLVKVNEVISARVGSLTKTVRVMALIEKRVGGTAAKDYSEDLTSAEEYQRAKDERHQPFFRYEGLGRPTKKDRRALDRLKGL